MTGQFSPFPFFIYKIFSVVGIIRKKKKKAHIVSQSLGVRHVSCVHTGARAPSAQGLTWLPWRCRLGCDVIRILGWGSISFQARLGCWQNSTEGPELWWLSAGGHPWGLEAVDSHTLAAHGRLFLPLSGYRVWYGTLRKHFYITFLKTPPSQWDITKRTLSLVLSITLQWSP